MNQESKVFIELEYQDGSTISFDVFPHYEGPHATADILMLSRGLLMASMGDKVTAWNSEGFEICSYIK